MGNNSDVEVEVKDPLLDESQREYTFKPVHEFGQNLHDLKNFEFLPTIALHNIFQFLDLKNLFTIIQTCQLFHRVVDNNVFWKSYYSNYTSAFLPKNEVNKNHQQEISWKKKCFDVKFLNFENRNEFFKKLFNGELYENVPQSTKREFNSVDSLGVHELTLFKILIIGEKGCGKTSLLNRFSEGTFNEEEKSTIGVDFKIKNFSMGEGGKNVKLQIWDSSGDQRFCTPQVSSFRGPNGILYCYDSSDETSFEKVKVWLENSRNSYGDRPGVLVGCKSDLRRDKNIGLERIKELFEEYKEISYDGSVAMLGGEEYLSKRFCECSAKNGMVDIPFGLIVQTLLKQQREKL